MKKIISLAIVMTMALAAIPALAGQTPVLDEWAQPVTVSGAKGGEAVAYQKADFDGECLVTGVNGDPGRIFNAVTVWTPQPGFRAVPVMTGSDYINNN
jgi:hypothetical protein